MRIKASKNAGIIIRAERLVLVAEEKLLSTMTVKIFSEKYKNIANTSVSGVYCTIRRDRHRGFCLIDYVVVNCFWLFEKIK